MVPTLRVKVASVPDRQSLVAEIWYGHRQVAEINEETHEPLIELYPNPDGGPWRIPLGLFLSAMREAAQRLENLGPTGDS